MEIIENPLLSVPIRLSHLCTFILTFKPFYIFSDSFFSLSLSLSLFLSPLLSPFCLYLSVYIYLSTSFFSLLLSPPPLSLSLFLFSPFSLFLSLLFVLQHIHLLKKFLTRFTQMKCEREREGERDGKSERERSKEHFVVEANRSNFQRCQDPFFELFQPFHL